MDLFTIHNKITTNISQSVKLVSVRRMSPWLLSSYLLDFPFDFTFNLRFPPLLLGVPAIQLAMAAPLVPLFGFVVPLIPLLGFVPLVEFAVAGPLVVPFLRLVPLVPLVVVAPLVPLFWLVPAVPFVVLGPLIPLFALVPLATMTPMVQFLSQTSVGARKKNVWVAKVFLKRVVSECEP